MSSCEAVDLNEKRPKGYIKLWRSLLDSAVFQNEKLLQMWIWCLLKANHKDKWVAVQTGKGKTQVLIQRGQFIFGRSLAGKELAQKPSTVRNLLQRLVVLGNVDTQTNTHYTIVTVRHYELYQSQASEERTGKRTGKGQPKDTTNNDKNDKKINICTFESFWSAYPRKVSKQAALKVWNKKKPDEELISAILKDIARKKESEEWKKNNGQFIPYPATYLRGERWTDELGTVAAITDDPFPDLQEL